MSEQDLKSWIGRTETADDMVTAAQVGAMSATFDRDDPLPRPGHALPAMWQWMFFTPKARHSDVGPDGHPKRGGFMPPVALPRRMFAGGRFTFHEPLRVSDPITRLSEILTVTEKQGRTGQLVFVTVRHRISSERGLAIEEENDIVYREAGTATHSPAGDPPRDPSAPWSRTIRPDPVLLFRFSALTFNGHRIHYDNPYVTGVEGYPGLIVHGPMIATMLADLARDHAGRALASFRFQAKRAVFDTAPFELVGGPDEDGGFWAQAVDGSGSVAMEAGGTFAG